MDYSIEQLSVDSYDKSNSVWDMNACPFTEPFREQVANGSQTRVEPNSLKHSDFRT